MKPLISSLKQDVINRCVKALKKNGMKHEVGMDPHDPGHHLVSVEADDYPKAMHILYPNRNNPRIGSVVWP
jgi:hypothetical protein